MDYSFAMDKTATTCHLCDHALSHHSIQEGHHFFCCPGCRVVFNILSSKKQLEGFQTHPVFVQAVQAGLISNPSLLEEIRRKQIPIPDSELQRCHFEIQEMWCPSCAEVIRLILLQQTGIRNCVVDYTTDLASVEFSLRHLSRNEIFQHIQRLGYQPVSLDEKRKAVSRDLSVRFIVAAFCSANSMMFAYPIYAAYFHDDDGYGSLFAWLSFVASLPVVTFCAWPILKRFWNSLKVGLYGMEALVIIGVFTAFFYSLYELLQGGLKVYFDSMTVVVTFVLLGKIIESKAKFSAKSALTALSRSLPRRGRKIFENGCQEFVPVKEIRRGDLLIAHAGEKIVLDGTVISGEGVCDESFLTGEPLPVAKKEHCIVLAGSILQNGSITYRIDNEEDASILAKIVNVVQNDLWQKTTYTRAVDKIVQWFIPLVILIALTTASACLLFNIGDLETAVLRAIAVLLIACPCAIGIAAPLVEAQTMHRFAELGALIRNRGALAILGSKTVFVFDKTGTITEGKFVLLSGLEQLSHTEQSLLKGIALRSSHLIAQAIAKAIQTDAATLTHVLEHAGMGISAFFQNHRIALGSDLFMKSLGISVPNQTNSSSTLVYFAIDQKCHILSLGDRLRRDAVEAISALKSSKTILLSGDAENSVKAVAEACGFSEWHARCSPLEKRGFIEKLREQGNKVVMIGDGINDAPSLTLAHVGISMVSASDISIHVSDILLTTERLTILPTLCRIATKGRRIIRQNLFWAFFYNVIGIALAIFGMLSPLFAAFAMMTSSLIILLNSRKQ